jgi:competence protein ComEC
MAGLGVWLYFALPAEPSAWALAAVTAAPAALAPLLVLGRRPPPAAAALAALALICAGFAAAALSARLAAAPVLPAPLDATVEGRVAEISRSAQDRRRVELDDVVIYGLAPSETPARVRVTLLEGAFAREAALGERIRVFARLSPPGGPVEPGGFDFRRHAWFERLGGIGFAMGPLVRLGTEPAPGPAAWVERRRGEMTEAVLAALPGRQGGFAAAILTGSRAEIGGGELQALRDSNLAHLLAISGLHMGLLVALAYAAARLALAAVPPLALRLPAKKTAAAAALAAAAAYLVFSGAAIATQRAFAMAAVALVAVMIDRPPVSMRALAAAALAVLALRPESLLSVGFQMSFAATAALVAVYEGVRARGWLRAERDATWRRRLAVYAAALLLTSLVAGLATAPYAAAAFNRAAHYGLLANMAAAPVMAFWVAPMGALAGLAGLVGLHGPPLAAMGWGIEAILRIAEATAALPGAVGAIGAPPAAALPLVTLGGLWLLLWRSRLRRLGAVPLAAGLALWAAGADRPEVLVAPEVAAIGALGPEGRAVNRARGAGYAVETWLDRDGDPAAQREAAQRPGLRRDDRAEIARLSNGWRVEALRGLAPPARLARRCREKVVLLAWSTPEGAAAPPGPCLALDRPALERLGALSLHPRGTGVRLRGALPPTARRLWAGPRPDPALGG